jgi:hypothetical protein
MKLDYSMEFQSNEQLQWAIPFENYMPPMHSMEDLDNISTGGVWILNGIANWATPFEIHTPSVKDLNL